MMNDATIRAVIAAVREPTARQIEIGMDSFSDPCWPENVAEGWRQMIDEIDIASMRAKIDEESDERIEKFRDLPEFEVTQADINEAADFMEELLRDNREMRAELDRIIALHEGK